MRYFALALRNRLTLCLLLTFVSLPCSQVGHFDSAERLFALVIGLITSYAGRYCITLLMRRCDQPIASYRHYTLTYRHYTVCSHLVGPNFAACGHLVGRHPAAYSHMVGRHFSPGGHPIVRNFASCGRLIGRHSGCVRSLRWPTLCLLWSPRRLAFCRPRSLNLTSYPLSRYQAWAHRRWVHKPHTASTLCLWRFSATPQFNHDV